MPTVQLVNQPSGVTLGSVVVAALGTPTFTELMAGVAYAKSSGVDHLARPLYDFRQRASVRMTVGIDLQGTTLEALQDLYLILGGQGCDLYILRNRASSPSPSFHPKMWLFTGPEHALLITGSGNLTGGGLYTNYEAGLALNLDFNEPADLAIHDDARAVLLDWSSNAHSHVEQVTDVVLTALHANGDLPSEAAARRAAKIARRALAKTGNASPNAVAAGLFGGTPVPAAPKPPPRPPLPPRPVVPIAPAVITPGAQTGAVAASSMVPQHRTLYMIVQPRQKTEVYLTKGALTDDGNFFGAPFTGLTRPRRPGNPGQPQPDPQPIVEIRVFSQSGAVARTVTDHPLKMWTYTYGKSANDDFRITLPSELLQLVPDDSVMVMERDPAPSLDYRLDFFPPAHPRYAALVTLCTTRVPASTRRYGWA